MLEHCSITPIELGIKPGLRWIDGLRIMNQLPLSAAKHGLCKRNGSVLDRISRDQKIALEAAVVFDLGLKAVHNSEMLADRLAEK